MLVIRIKFPLSIILISESFSSVSDQINPTFAIKRNLKELLEIDDEILFGHFVTKEIFFSSTGNVSIVLNGSDG